jgi:hypothetical protein
MSLFLVKDSVLGFAEFTHTGFAQKEMIKGYPGLYINWDLASARFGHPMIILLRNIYRCIFLFYFILITVGV